MRPKTSAIAAWHAAPNDRRIMRHITLSATITPYLLRLKQWIDAGCPDDAFLRSENARGRLTDLGLPEWAARFHIVD